MSEYWIRGTTPTLKFTLPIMTSQITAGHIAVRQGKTLIVRDIADCKTTNESISTKLTQAETLSFVRGVPVEIQFRCKLLDGSALATDIYERDVEDIIKDGVI